MAQALERSRQQPMLLRRTLRRWTDWTEFYETRIANVVFCPTDALPEVGTRVLIDLVIIRDPPPRVDLDGGGGATQPRRDAGPRVRLEGRVSGRRAPSRNGRLPAGVRIRLSHAQRKLLDRIDAWLRSGVRNRRRHRRLPLRVRAVYGTWRSRRRVSFAADLSLDGLFLSSREVLPPRTPIWLSLFLPGEGAPLQLSGRVARCAEAAGQQGLGVELAFVDERGRRRYAALLGRLEDRYMGGTISQRHLG